ncbi:MAG TPA: hypothetical protein VK053_06295 [Jiangellaceae bacterium]|nr:hypothetical protein [Jiangellaceae bacterium]
MSESDNTEQAAGTEGTSTDEGQDAAPDTGTGSAGDVDKWKAIARKHEQRAKENADKAKEYDAYVESQKSESQKLTDAQKAAEARATAAEADAARLRAALEHGLSKDDLDLLGSGTADEITQRAERLAERLKSAKPAYPDLAQGRGTPGESKPTVNDLFRAAARK